LQRRSRFDEEIASAAVNRLKCDSSVPVDAVKAKVEKGRVTLTGEVDWHYQQQAAVDAVRSILGVIGVSNDITIKPRPNTSEIRNNIMVALDRSWFDPASITVTAHNGKVNLTGSVESWYEREEASAAAWAAPGTTSVNNNITVA
jgi:osmotically-inducible protein OsmY